MKKHITILLTIFKIQLMYSQRIPFITSTDKITEPIVISDLHISVFVLENIATTTMEMRFYNDNDRIMEGEFNFPLAQGVSVARFALDVNGTMREGVAVEKEKATQAFEAVTRRNVDPGIVEITKGNNIKARVYPIPAKGYKKAIIAYEQEISGDDEHYIYQPRLKKQKEIERLKKSMRMEQPMNLKPWILHRQKTLTKWVLLKLE